MSLELAAQILQGQETVSVSWRCLYADIAAAARLAPTTLAALHV